MNILSDKTIEQILKEDYKHLKTIYPHDQILGIFTFGMVNYGFAENISDIQVKMYYLPTLEEMCTRIQLKDESFEYNGHMIYVKDIRLILDNILSQEGTAMECFFSDFYIVTPKFKKVFVDVIKEKREEIFRCSPTKRIQHSIDQAFEALELYKYTNNPVYLFEACRRRLAAILYLRGDAIADCIKFKKDYHINYLWNIKQGLSLPNIEEVIEDLHHMKAEAENLDPHPELEDLVKTSIVNIMKIALTRTIDEQEFLKALTKTEKSALKIIMQYIDKNGEGIVSVSQLTEENNISRPVFKSVLQKLKDMEIAEITNMGVKGTQITIIDGAFLNIDELID